MTLSNIHSHRAKEWFDLFPTQVFVDLALFYSEEGKRFLHLLSENYHVVCGNHSMVRGGKNGQEHVAN